jgi:Family of unknown function (DUF6090)
MIKFFRKIRYNLMEQNKTGKYLKYAIGEIVLVVIGILIALQINNWNDKRNIKLEREAQRQSNLEEIYHDLKSDVIVLDAIINQLQGQKEASKYVLMVLESDDKYVSDSLKFFQNQFKATGSVTVNRTKNTWDNLNTSGQLLSLKEDFLNKKLFEYYTYYDSRIKNFNELPKDVRLKFRKSTAPCEDLENMSKILEGNGLIHPNSRWFSCYLYLDGVHESLIPIFISSHYNINWFTLLKTQAISIIDYMKVEHSQDLNFNKK